MTSNLPFPLDPIAETLLIPLYYRAIETQRSDAILRDPRAAEVLTAVGYDGSALRNLRMQQVVVAMRARQFDRTVASFLAAGHAAPVVVEIGCGLDTRFERLGSPTVAWYNLDLPEVIDLRARLLGTPVDCTDLAGSAFELAWLDRLPQDRGRAFLFLAEGVFPYFHEDDVRRLALAIMARWPGAELVFDAIPPLQARLSAWNPLLRGRRARSHWGMRSAAVPEGWAPGIRLLSAWHYWDDPEPRMRPYRWMRRSAMFGEGFQVVHYRLGEPAKPHA
jgi:O-methyltransferase involved in polyketide biosynthesis